jgi:hypothetical protein
MQGFAVNDATVTGITNSFVAGKKILLHEDSTADAKSSALPSACYLSHLDLQLNETGATASEISAFLAWDSDGDDPMTGVSEGNKLWTGLTTTTLRNTSIALDVWVTAPAGQTTQGKCYLWLKTDSGTVECTKARLHWALRETV